MRLENPLENLRYTTYLFVYSQGVSKPFKDVIKANIGDAHAMGQAPVVFLRQVLGLVVNPDGMNDPTIPDDAKERAKAILDGCKVQNLP